MNQSQISLPPEQFAAVFPFHFACDSRLIVRQVGASLARLCPALLPGAALDAHLRIEHPTVPLTFSSLQRSEGQLFVFALLSPPVRLCGQVVFLPTPGAPTADRMVFLGSPWLAEQGKIRRLGLTLSKLALQDPVGLLQTVQDQAMLEASRLRLEFLANMSDVIRTPLNTIIDVAEILSETPMAPRQQELVGIIGEAGSALLALTSDILDIARIEAGHRVLEERTFDLRACIESALDVAATKALAKNLELAYLIEVPAPQWLQGDEGRLRQVLLNLVGNAIKFTDQGAVTVVVTPQVSNSRRLELHFAVHDTGLGIPPEQQERLFHTFGQLDDSTTRKYAGAGLGLAISRRLVEGMGGQMWMESSGIRGLGSTFHFIVPYFPGGSPAERTPRQSTPLAEKRVLLVTGDVGSAVEWRNIILLLETWGAEPLVCSTLANALEWLQAGNQVDVALADERLMQAQIDREAVAASSLLRLVLISTLGQQSQIARVPVAGRVTRPVRAVMLAETLTAALGASGVSALTVNN